MKKYTYRLPPFRYWCVIGIAAVFVVVYLVQVGRSLAALAFYQRFLAVVASGKTDAPLTEQQHVLISDLLHKIIRFEAAYPQYWYELGSYLHRYAVGLETPAREAGFQEAEQAFKRAAALDPASPWSYYELGRLDVGRGDFCETLDSQTVEVCPSAKYFRRALLSAPTNMFLRQVVGLWFYERNDAAAFHVMREAIAAYNPDEREAVFEFARFLYEMALDTLSDQYYAEYMHTNNGTPPLAEACPPLLHTKSILYNNDPIFIGCEETEFGNDDGTGEWPAFLASDRMRIKKVLCVPSDVDDYNYAALKISMSYRRSAQFILKVFIDEHLIKTYMYDVPQKHGWHEIPFNKEILAGKSRINVYLRVEEADLATGSLRVWGDQDTPNRTSTWNFDATDDLSIDQGNQHGEYLIRLVLKKL